MRGSSQIRNRESGRRNVRSGFTLLELIVAAAVLAVGTVAVLEAITRGLANTKMSYEHTRAISLAEAKMAELRATGSSANGTEEGSFADSSMRQAPSEDYRWRTEVQPSQEDGLALARVSVLWESGTRTRQVTIESLLPRSTKGTGTGGQ